MSGQPVPTADHPHWHDGTRCVHAGLPEPAPGQPFLPGPVFAAPYHLDPWQGPAGAVNGYGRPDNPTRRLLEAAIGELEGGDCRVFATGQAAITGLLLAVLRPGDTVLLPADGYFPVRAFATATLAGHGGTGRLRAHRRAVPVVRRGTAGAAGDPGEPGPGRGRHRRTGRARRTRPVRWSRWTTPPPPRSGSARWTSVRTWWSPPAPRR